LLRPLVGIRSACDFSGISRATWYRKRSQRPVREGPREARPAPPGALSPGERAGLLEILDSARFADKAPRQVWAALADEGTYLASVSTMYRVLRAAHQVRERRTQARHPAKAKPELAAYAPNEVWSWDITKLQGPAPGVFYHLYVILDIFSRCVVHWEAHSTELGELAAKFMEEAFRVNGGIVPGAIHSDRGTSMTSKPVTTLLADLEILKTHSRPKVSNDNPYSEAQFKTLKYCPVFPGEFGSLQDARRFCEKFFAYYNHDHYHSGIGLHTPYSMHIGTAGAIQQKRQAVLSAAYAATPGRFTRRPRPPALPRAAWINEPLTPQHQPQEAA
jgi:putative transposase